MEFREKVGILLSGGTGSRLFPITEYISKQLVPVYDKPIVYYGIDLLLKNGIKEIIIVTNTEYINVYEKIKEIFKETSIDVKIIGQNQPNGIAESFILASEYIFNKEVHLLLGDNIFINTKMAEKLKSVDLGKSGIVFTKEVSEPNSYGVVRYSENGDVLDIIEKPQNFVSNRAVTGYYVYKDNVFEKAASLTPSERGELEITDLNRLYLSNDDLEVIDLDEDAVWFDCGSPQSLADASNFVGSHQNRTGIPIGSVELTAKSVGCVSEAWFESRLTTIEQSSYGKMLRRLEAHR